jgi:hypothetical protein
MVHGMDSPQKLNINMIWVRNAWTVVKYCDIARGISHQLVIPALHELGFGGVPRGLFCATPFEVLHTLMLGTMKYTLLSLFNFKIVTVSTHTNSSTGVITSTTKVSKPLMIDKIERRIRVLSMHSKRQSVRDMPWAVFNKGVTTFGGIQGQEYVGLSILTIQTNIKLYFNGYRYSSSRQS